MVESVWDYPRPPRVEPLRLRARVVVSGVTIAESSDALRVLETSHPPVIYFPPADVAISEYLQPADGTSLCEWKGTASYFDLTLGGRRIARAAWTYRKPAEAYRQLQDYVAFYPGRVDACFIGDEQVRAQAGDFYGGWITAGITGPFKGQPGTDGW